MMNSFKLGSQLAPKGGSSVVVNLVIGDLQDRIVY